MEKHYEVIKDDEGKIEVGATKNLLRERKTVVYKGWVMTAEDKFKGVHDGRIWITAIKGEQKDEDDTLTYLLTRIDEKEGIIE